MSSSNRLAYLATNDMVEQARRVLPVYVRVAITTLLMLLLAPAFGPVAYNHSLFARQSANSRHASVQQQDEDEYEYPEDLITSTEQMIEKMIAQKERELLAKEAAMDGQASGSAVTAMPSIRPIAGEITSEFGMRVHPVYNRMMFHAGTDFSASVGTRVVATADGTVSSSGFEKGGYGKKVVIDHGFGFQTVYAHLSKAVVRQGQHIRRGDIIAFSGNTGRSTGPHLHYEVRKDGFVVNPTAYFPEEQAPDKLMTLHDDEPEQVYNPS
jgi:murein DD-endopeptidase MepM/ murein hydrolase activator NlpD